MKKIILLAIVMLCLVYSANAVVISSCYNTSPSTITSDYLLYTTFDSETTGDAPSGWFGVNVGGEYQSASPGGWEIVSSPTSLDKSMIVNTTNDANLGIYRNLTTKQTSADTFTIEFGMAFNTSTVGNGNQIRGGDSSSLVMFTVIQEQGDDWTYHDGSAKDDMGYTQPSDNLTHNISFVVNLTAETSTFFADGVFVKTYGLRDKTDDYQAFHIKPDNTAAIGTFSIREVYIYSGTICPLPSGNLIFSNYNMTSNGGCTDWNTAQTTPCNTTDTTPTFSFDTDRNATCRVSTLNINFNQMNATRNCTSTGNVSHICTIISNDSIINAGNNNLYASCWNGSQSTQTGALVVSYQNTTLTCDGNANNAKYEYGTTANCTVSTFTGDTVCIDIDAPGEGVNVTCGTSSVSYNFTINVLRNKNFSDGELTKNFTLNPINITIRMDNRTDIINASINLTGYIKNGAYPENLTIYKGDRVHAMFPGFLKNSTLFIYRFIFEDLYYNILNLSYAQQESKTIWINASSTNFNPINLSFNITGYNVDADNEVAFIEYFNNTNASTNLINGSIKSGIGIYENFENLYTDTSGRWTQTETGGWSTSDDGFTTGQSDNYYLMEHTDTGSSGAKTLKSTLDMVDLDIQNISWININRNMAVSGGGGRPHATGGTTLYFTDGTAQVLVRDWTCSNCGTQSITENLTINRTNSDSNSWAYSVNGIETGTFSTTTLDSTKPWRLRFFGRCYSTVAGAPNACYSRLKIYNIEIGSALANKSTTGPNYASGNITSKIVFVAPSNFSAATLETVDFTPTNTSIYYYLSNNNGSTWELVLKGIRNVFESAGNNLTWRAVLTTDNVNVTPMVHRVNIDIVPSAVENITIDLSADFSDDYNFTSQLNSSTSPQFVFFPTTNTSTMNQFFVYSQQNCNDTLTCLYPIKISADSGGVIEINNFTFTQNPNEALLNSSDLETCKDCVINISFKNGTVGIDDVRFNFLGSHNITLIAHNTSYSENKTFTVFVRYSKFDLTLPANISYWEFFPTASIQSNVTPYGQSNSTPIWNVSNDAYDDPFDIYVKANSSLNSCINLTFSNSNSKVDGIVANTISQRIKNSLALNSYAGVWNYLDLVSCSGPFLIPWFEWCGICSDCVKTSDYCDSNLITT